MTTRLNKMKTENFKISIWVLFCVVFFLIISIGNLFSQVIIGNVFDCGNNDPIENVNIHVKGTSIGSSSNKFGFFEINYNFNKKEKQLLIISHLNYNEKIIDLNEGQIPDTLNICLESKAINLSETTISAGFTNVYGQHNYSILDFNFIDKNVLLLVLDYRKNAKDLILTNSLFDTISYLSSESLKKAINIYKDCMGKCHVVCKDTVYQIDYYDSILTINYPIPSGKFDETIGACLFESTEYLVFKTTSTEGFYNRFYAVNKEDHSTKLIHSALQSKKLKKRNAEINWILTHPYLYPHIHEAIFFEKKIMFQPSLLSMNKVGDSIYLFDHSNDSIDVYTDDLNYARSIKIKYHLNKKWNENIIIDQVANKAYTTITENNLETLYSIDLAKGSLVSEVKIPYVFPYKVAINDGYLFVLFKEFTNQAISKRIYRFKL